MHPAERVAGIPRGTGSPCCSFHPSGSTERVALTWLLGSRVDFGSTWPIHTTCSRKNRQRYPPHTRSLFTLRRNKPPINHTTRPQPDLIPLTDFPAAQGKTKGRKLPGFWMEDLLPFRCTGQGASSNYIYYPGGTIVASLTHHQKSL